MTYLFRQLLRIADTIDLFSEWSGRAVSWLVVAMVLLVVFDVTMRYLFASGSVALQELEWHLFALVFLLGSAYTLKHDGHVRVDIIYGGKHVTERGRAWVDLLGGVLFLLPFCAVVIWSSLSFVHNAYVFGEGSPDAGGLPYRFLLKAAIPLGFLVLALQGLSGIMRAALVLARRAETRD